MTREETLDAIMAVMETAFDPHWREAWSRAQVAGSMAIPSTHALIVDAWGDMPTQPADAAGFVLSRHVADEEELLLIAVRPGQRGRGLGRDLIQAFAAASRKRGADTIFLEVRANNPAMSLYKRLGFTKIGQRADYYRTLDGQAIDAITLARKLK